MTARQLFREGVVAIRDHHDHEQAQSLLRESLKLAPDNIDAWLWLSKTTNDPALQLRCVERALTINPTHLSALKLKDRLTVKVAQSQKIRRRPKPKALSNEEQHRIKDLMKSAARADKKGDSREAIRCWMDVLDIEVDHNDAMERAVNALWKIGYYSDAKILLQRAYDAQTQSPVVYLTGASVLDREGRHREADELSWFASRLPEISSEQTITIVDRFLKTQQHEPALKIMERAIKRSPRDQALLLKMGDVQAELGNHAAATAYFDYVARLGTRSQAGKEADKRLSYLRPDLSAIERKSMLLAFREAVGISLFFAILAIQDAGLTIEMKPTHWLGIGISLVGAYLVVTATSSPQQSPLATWLSSQNSRVRPSSAATRNHPVALPLLEAKQVPTLSDDIRIVLGLVGVCLLLAALKLVFGTTIDLMIEWYKAIGIL